jgi:phosphoglycerate kinase
MTIPLQTWNMHNKWILLRIDGNVPLRHGIIVDDYRLQQIIPTIDYILGNNGRIILLTQIGRPTGHEEALSTKQLMPWFATKYSIAFAATLEDIAQLQKTDTKLILLENLRFFKEEKALSLSFAQKLASYGDLYVNDAFATLHRNHTSITLLAQQFCADDRSIGFLVEKELSMLNALINRHSHPSLIILGGAKLETKIPLIHSLLDYIDTIFIGPALASTFMKAQGIAVGKSLVKEELVDTCKEILQKANTSHCSLIFPQDYIVARDNIDGPLSFSQGPEIPNDSVGISIGEKTINTLKTIIEKAKIIFLNGSMGFSDKPKTMDGMNALLKMLNASSATTIIAGGDTVSYARSQDLLRHITYISTGGGATISYLSGSELPGLVVLKYGTESQ